MENRPNNVTQISDKKPVPVATHTISYILDGFPVTTALETSADIRAVVDRLKAIGAEPPTQHAPSPQANGDGAKKALPKCPVHRSPMKESRGGKGFYCPRKDDDGYCDETA